MIEYLQRCGFDLPTWLLFFAVIMDSRPGHVDHRGVCSSYTSPAVIGYLRGLWDGHFGRVYLLPWPATMEMDQISVEIPDQTRRTAATLALLTVPRFLFPCCSITKEIKKQRHREFALCRCMLYTLHKNLHAICSFVLSE